MKYIYTSKRVGATLIDYTLVFVLTYLYIYTVGTRDDNGVYHLSGLPVLPLNGLWFVYFVITERYMGGTMGHQIFKLKVISMDGNELGFWQVFLRRICDALEITLCFGLIAFLLVKTSPYQQRLGDMVAKTRVIGKQDPATEAIFDFEHR
jgi:uncharacterized RDD family membrane protein YckC